MRIAVSDVLSSAPPSSADRDQALLQIATAAVELGALGPTLAHVAGEMARQSTEQARLAKAVADNMRELTRQLERATSHMRDASADVEGALATVSRIAQHTKIIAINATIEAARAGAHGVAFGVVVEEVQRLAERTSTTTSDIEERVRELHSSIARVAAMTGDEQVATSDTEGSSVAKANTQIQDVADAANRQLATIDRLKGISSNVAGVTDTLVIAVGSFRFAAHQRAERQLALLLRDLDARSFDRGPLESAIERWLEHHPHFELAYMTNAAGRQIVDNIRRVDGRVVHDPHGLNRDWSQRPWYRDAVARTGAHSTDVYRSAATGEFCFTIASALRDARGTLRGVVAADVNFQQLLAKQ